MHLLRKIRLLVDRIVSFFLNRYSMQKGRGTKIKVTAVKAIRVHSPIKEIMTRDAAAKSSVAANKTILGISILFEFMPLPISPHLSSILLAARYASLMQA